MQFFYPIVEGDSGPWDVAQRFKITAQFAKMREMNAATPWQAGNTWELPFTTDPNDGLAWAEFPFSERPKSLDDIVKHPEAVTLPGADGKERGVPLWTADNIKRVLGNDPKKGLWMHWANRVFRAWQVKNGGSIDGLKTKSKDGKESSPPLWLLFPKPIQQAPAVAAPVTSNGTAGDAAPAPNAVNVNTPSAVAMAALVKEVVRRRDSLATLLDRQEAACRVANGFYATARAMSGLADAFVPNMPKLIQSNGVYVGQVFRLSGGRAPGAGMSHSSGKAAAQANELKAKANAFYAQVNAKINPVTPVDSIAKGLVEEVTGEASGLANFLRDPANIKVIKDFAADAAITAENKSLLLLRLGAFITDQGEVGHDPKGALDFAMRAPKAKDIFATMLDNALIGKPDDSVLTAISDATAVLIASVGNVPGAAGPDPLFIGVLKLWGATVVAAAGNNKAAAAGIEKLLGERLAKGLKLDDNLTTQFEQKLEALKKESIKTAAASGPEVDQTAKLASREELEKFLTKRFARVQGGMGLNAAMIVVNLIQLVLLYKSLDDNAPDAIAAYATLGATALQTGSTIVAFIGNRWWNGKFLKMRASLLLDLGEKMAPSLNVMLAAMSIVSGEVTMEEGLAEGDKVKVAAGAFQLASGLAMLAGLACASGIGIGVGVVLGFVSSAISMAGAAADANETPAFKVFKGLLKTATEQKVDKNKKDGQTLVETLGLTAELKALQKAFDDADPFDVFALLQSQTQADVTANKKSLSGLAFSDALVASLVAVPPQPAPLPQPVK